MGATLLGTAAVMQDQISAEGSISTADTTVNQNTAPCASGIYLESLVLKDKRRLAYRVQGEGVPIYLLHGMGSSHLTWRTKPEKDLAQLCPGVRLILIDRPGYGDSDMPPAGYSYTQWAEDLAQLADHLGDSTFAVAGHSSGGPYALAAAALLRDRVVACASISSDPPYAHPNATDAVRGSDFIFRVDGPSGMYGQDPMTRFQRSRENALKTGDPDRIHAWKGGTLGFVTDYLLERAAWSFKLEDITLGDGMTFWVGDEDNNAMKLGAPWMQTLVPGSQLRITKGNHNFKTEPQNLQAIFVSLRDHIANQCGGAS